MRFPPHSKGVGYRFQPLATPSNKAMILAGDSGCCPANPRLLKIRCIDSAIFNQEPPKGVYNGIMPCANNQRTNSAVVCPRKLSQIKSIRKPGSSWGRVMGRDKPTCQAFQSCRLVSAVSGAAGGNVSRIILNSAFNQGCKITFALLRRL